MKIIEIIFTKTDQHFTESWIWTKTIAKQFSTYWNNSVYNPWFISKGRSILNAGAVQTASSLSSFPVKKVCKDSLVNFRYRRYASPLCLGHKRIALLLIGIMEQDTGFEPALSVCGVSYKIWTYIFDHISSEYFLISDLR